MWLSLPTPISLFVLGGLHTAIIESHAEFNFGTQHGDNHSSGCFPAQTLLRFLEMNKNGRMQSIVTRLCPDLSTGLQAVADSSSSLAATKPAGSVPSPKVEFSCFYDISGISVS